MKIFTISTFFPGFWWNFPEILQIVHTFPQILTLSVKKSKNSAKFSSKSSRKNFIFHSANEISFFILQNFDAAFLLKNCDWSGAKECESCRSRKMLKNAPTLAIVAVHTEENEPPKVLKPKNSFISFGSWVVNRSRETISNEIGAKIDSWRKMKKTYHFYHVSY